MNTLLPYKNSDEIYPLHIIQSVLIVDSDSVVAETMSKLIREINHISQDFVNNLNDLEQSIQNKEPDMVIINFDTKGELDGYQIAKIFKLDYEIPFCILYKEDSRNLKKWANELNPDGFISYSSNCDFLKTQLNTLLN